LIVAPKNRNKITLEMIPLYLQSIRPEQRTENLENTIKPPPFFGSMRKKTKTGHYTANLKCEHFRLKFPELIPPKHLLHLDVYLVMHRRCMHSRATAVSWDTHQL
jgi:hypothetical protein